MIQVSLGYAWPDTVHELSLTEMLIEQATEAARQERVLAIHVRLGRQGCVTAEALQNCFEIARQDTALAEARLEIELVAGDDFYLVALEVE